MGTDCFIIVKTRNLTGFRKRILREFGLMQHCQCAGYPDGKGVDILKFLRKIIEENRWEEFCEKFSKLELDLTEGPEYEEFDFLGPVKDDDEHVALEKIKKAFVKDVKDKRDVYIAKKWTTVSRSVFEEITASPEILKRRINYMKVYSRYTGAEILDLVMNDQVHAVAFCGDRLDLYLWGYVIDCTTKQLLVYTQDRLKKIQAKLYDGENPLGFMGSIPLVGRFNIDDLPSDEEFCKKLEIIEDDE